MMTTHSREAVRAIMAHEVGHVLGGDTRLSMKLAGVIERWFAVEGSIHREGKEPLKIVSRFLDWYLPRLNARRLVLSRAQEHLADATISRVTSPSTAAMALIGTEIKQRAMNEVMMKKLQGMARESEAPPPGYYQMLRNVLNDPQTYEKADEWITEALKVPTQYGDTHPTLRDRLNSILGRPDMSPQLLRDMGCWPELDRGDAAEHYLGAELDFLLAEFNASWVDGVRESWTASHQLQEEDTKRREEIEQRLAKAEGTREEELERALIMEREGDEAGAMALVDALLERDPKFEAAHFFRGRVLLQRNEIEGLRVLHEVIQLDPRWGPDCYTLMYDYHLRNGSKEGARDAEMRFDQSVRILAEAEQERQALYPGDQFHPHKLDPQKVEEIVRALSEFSRVRRAWLVRKHVRTFPEIDCHCLIIEYDSPWFGGSAKALDKVLGEILEKVTLPPDVACWLNVFKHVRGIKKKIRRASGQPIYDRREWKKMQQQAPMAA